MKTIDEGIDRPLHHHQWIDSLGVLQRTVDSLEQLVDEIHTGKRLVATREDEIIPEAPTPYPPLREFLSWNGDPLRELESKLSKVDDMLRSVLF